MAILKKLFVFIVLAACSVALYAQKSNDPVIFEINGKKIYKSEFMREFLRSIGKDPAASPTACTYEKRKALTDYVELYVNYRAKLEDAHAQGIDTLPSLVAELKGYRNELASPYLIDSATSLRLMKEAYDRNHYTLHASHILVRVKPNAEPKDTLEAYNKAMEYYNRVMGGENFNRVANEAVQVFCDQMHIEPDDKRRRDDGDLGCFTVFDMVYPFETAAYNLQPGEISKPVRTQFGYHIIKLYTKVPYFGKSTFQHIWCSTDKRPEYTEYRAREAYDQIINGTDFAVVCANYSDDNSTLSNGGLMVDVPIRQIPSEYIFMLSQLKPGELSVPFQTQYGWHILKLISRDSIPAYEDMVPLYKQRMARDTRSNEPRKAFIEQCKKKYNFIDYTQMKTKPAVKKGKKSVAVPLATLDECVKAVDDRVLNRQWQFADSMVTDLRPLCSVGDKEYNAVDFLRYIERNQHADRPQSMQVYVDNRYKMFIDDMVFSYADARLEEENPEFAELINEYRNGLMIFTYNNDNVWTRAFADTVGFQNFYRQEAPKHNIDNPDDAVYFWNERAQVTVVTINDSASLKPSKGVKILQKAVKKQLNREQIYGKFFSALPDSAHFTVDEQLLEREHQELLSDAQWRPGVYVAPQSHGYKVFCVHRVLDPCLKSIKEARGYYVNDYQNYLDKQLVETLRKKYNVVIHQDVIDEITY